jgi:hypothetical protein
MFQCRVGSAEEVQANETTYETVTCLACQQDPSREPRNRPRFNRQWSVTIVGVLTCIRVGDDERKGHAAELTNC